ncbi:GntR family transcriptional regulator [Dactylosporangium sp. CA-152071]|uniref:GntR family transcriptional regulator n=1 Tax=Dactylosporangium sp. CA-152071 TaxID=3239933 RepID=UPI003D92F071
MVDRNEGRALHRQLADLLRDQITAGQLRPGAYLPSETYLGQTHDMSRTAVRRAIDLLVNEGLLTKSRGQRTRVREQRERRVVLLAAGDDVETRMPTEAERHQLGIPIGEPVFVVRRAGGRVELHAGSSSTLRAIG